MLRFEGDHKIPVDSVTVWNRLSDTKYLFDCIPDAQLKGERTATGFTCTIHPGLSFVRGTLDITLLITEAEYPSKLTYLISGKGIGSSNTVEVQLSISPEGAETLIHWVADIKELGGLLKAVPKGLIRGAAQKVIEDLWGNVDKKIAPPPP